MGVYEVFFHDQCVQQGLEGTRGGGVSFQVMSQISGFLVLNVSGVDDQRYQRA